ncbi:MAG: DUF4234 domain-containing protein [Thermoplasmata archaeon]
MDSIPTGPPGRMPVQTMPFSEGFHLDGARQQLLAAVNARNVTDVRIPKIWVLLPIIVYIASIIVIAVIFAVQVSDLVTRLIEDPSYIPTDEEILQSMGWLVTVSLIWSIISYALFAVLTYKLLNRHNEHFERESHLRMGIISFLRAAAGSPERESIVSSEIATMNMLQSESSSEEPRRSSVLWALVIGFMWVPVFNLIAMILSLYMFYFLMKEIWEHDRRFHEFMAQTYSALSKLGYQFSPMSGVRALERRSFILYLVLSILTLGLFVLYWWYVLAKDPEEHYREQWYVEDHLATTIAQK